MNNLILYHSTTDFYLSSIRKYGLGGINPNYSLGILDFLKNLYTISETYLSNNHEYQKLRFSTYGMVNQIVKGSFNFKHNKTYLAINESTAIRYSSNEYGSELLTRCMFLYKLLIQKGYYDKINTSLLKIDINDFIIPKHNKILIKVKNINPNDLETETGKNAVEKLKEIDLLKTTDIDTYNILSQQFNFALKVPIDYSELEILEISLGRNKENKTIYNLKKYVY